MQIINKNQRAMYCLLYIKLKIINNQSQTTGLFKAQWQFNSIISVKKKYLKNHPAPKNFNLNIHIKTDNDFFVNVLKTKQIQNLSFILLW